MIYLAYKWGGGYSKSEIDTLLTSKADTSHTHTKSDITDFPTIPSKTSELTNDSGFLTSHQDLSGYVPRSGGAVMNGNRLSPTRDNYEFNIDGGVAYTHGATLWLTGKDFGGNQGIFELISHNGSSDKHLRGQPDGTLIWSGQSIQTTSDQRLKQQISNIDDKLLDAWEDVLPCQFKYNDAVEQKGNTARLHTGYVVQQINEACQKHDVDISEYGLYCHEEYPERTEEVTIENEDGTTKKETKVIEPAKEYYSLRYTETLVVECAYLRRENAKLKEQLQKHEDYLKLVEEHLHLKNL